MSIKFENNRFIYIGEQTNWHQVMILYINCMLIKVRDSTITNSEIDDVYRLLCAEGLLEDFIDDNPSYRDLDVTLTLNLELAFLEKFLSFSVKEYQRDMLMNEEGVHV